MMSYLLLVVSLLQHYKLSTQQEFTTCLQPSKPGKES